MLQGGQHGAQMIFRLSLTRSLGLLEGVFLAERVLDVQDAVAGKEVTGDVELGDNEVDLCSTGKSDLASCLGSSRTNPRA